MLQKWKRKGNDHQIFMSTLSKVTWIEFDKDSEDLPTENA